MSVVLFWLWLFGCSGDPVFIVEGTVVEVQGPTSVILDHEDVPGLMGPMVMPFKVADSAMLDGLEPGHRVVARYRVSSDRSELTKLRVVGREALPEQKDDGPIPLRTGQLFPALTIPTADGGEVVLGPEQTERIALTFLYTRCPIPEYCPAIVARLQALQPHLQEQQRVVAVTLDPEHDTLELLAEYAEGVGAQSAKWTFGRVEQEPLADLAMRAGLPVVRQGEEIAHGLRLLTLDVGGVLIERYDDNRWPQQRVLQQLQTGGPRPPPGSGGTVGPEE